MLATNIGTGLVVGQFGMGVVDGPDVDREPEVIPLAGSVTFTPSIPYLPNQTADPNPITIVTAPIKGILDVEGYLCTPAADGVTPMYRGIRLFATDDPDASVQNWTYSVTYRFGVVNGATPAMKAHSIAVPEGAEVDLTHVVEVPSSPGIGTPQALALLAGAEAAAASAELASAAAEAVALQVRADADAGLFKGDPGPAGPNSVPTAEFVAGEISNPASPVAGALSAAIGSQAVRRGELLFNVLDFGAKGDGDTDDTAAIQSAINAAISSSGGRYGTVVLFPGSYGSYRYTQLMVEADNQALVTLRGQGNATLRPLASADSLGPSIIIRPKTTPTEIGVGYLKYVRIEHLRISGTGYVLAPSRTNPGDTDPYSAHRKRVGILVETTQVLSMNDVYISHFRVGLHGKDLFDSELQKVEFMHCGYSVGSTDDAVTTGNWDTGYGYSLVLDRALDQSNANKFLNCHFEGGPLFVQFRNYSRQNHFTGCKFENRTPAQDDTSSKSAIWTEAAIDNQFANCMFTEDATRNKPYIDGTTTDNGYVATYNVRQALLFSNNLFFANSESEATWFRGGWAKFMGNHFTRCNGRSTHPYVMVLTSYNTLIGNTFTMAGDGRRLFRVGSSRNIIADNVCVANTATGDGALLLVDTGASGCKISDNHAQGTWPTLMSSPLTDMGSVVCINRLAPSKGSTSATPNVAFAEWLDLTYASATTVTNLVQGYHGQRVTLRSVDGRATIRHGSAIILKGAVDRLLTTDATVTLVSIAGIWREV